MVMVHASSLGWSDWCQVVCGQDLLNDWPTQDGLAVLLLVHASFQTFILRFL